MSGAYRRQIRIPQESRQPAAGAFWKDVHTQRRSGPLAPLPAAPPWLVTFTSCLPTSCLWIAGLASSPV